MATYTYSPKDAVCSIGGAIITNWDSVEVERREDGWEMVVGADGEVSRKRNANKTGQGTISLQQTSASNDVLSALAIADELTSEGVVPFLLKDLSGRTICASKACWVKKFPKASFKNSFEMREWAIDFADLNMFVGGNTAAGVF